MKHGREVWRWQAGRVYHRGHRIRELLAGNGQKLGLKVSDIFKKEITFTSVFGVSCLGIGDTRTIPRARISASRTVCIYSFQSSNKPRGRRGRRTVDIRKGCANILLPKSIFGGRKYFLTSRQFRLFVTSVCQIQGGLHPPRQNPEFPRFVPGHPRQDHRAQEPSGAKRH